MHQEIVKKVLQCLHLQVHFGLLWSKKMSVRICIDACMTANIFFLGPTKIT